MSLKKRFEHELYNHYAKMKNVLLAAINGEEVYEEGIEVLRNEYSDAIDMNSLIMEFLILKVVHEEKNHSLIYK